MNATLHRVPIGRIQLSPQVRRDFDPAGIQELADSISGTGLQHPPLCRRQGEDLVLIDGERRVRACRTLKWSEIPVLVIEDPVDKADALARQLVCNLQRSDLNAVDRAMGIQALMEQASLTAEQAAKKLGLSSAAVSRALAILKLPGLVQQQVARGEIPADSAYQLSRVADAGEQAALASDVAANRLSRDGLARKLKRVRRADESRSAAPNRVTATLGGGRTLTVVGRAMTIDSVIEWLEQFLSKARKSKAHGISLETFIRTLRDQATKA